MALSPKQPRKNVHPPSKSGFIMSPQGMVVRDFPRSRQNRRWRETSKEDAREALIAEGASDEYLVKLGLDPRDKDEEKGGEKGEGGDDPLDALNNDPPKPAPKPAAPQTQKPAPKPAPKPA